MTKNQFIKEILDRTCLPYEYRRKIKRDFLQEFDSKLAQGLTEAEVIESMGDADDIAAEIYESYMNNREVSRPFVEYKSDKTIFGMPLVHIVKSKRKRNYFIRGIGDDRNRYMNIPTAKGFIAIGQRARGIIAIGLFSCGIISIGVLSVGLISLTMIGLGLIALGNISVGLLLALGNVAVGTFSLGNVAIAYAALGNASFGKYTIGNDAYGINKIILSNLQPNKPIDQNIIDFINNTPTIVKSFYNNILSIIQSSIDNYIILLVLLGIILFAAIIFGVVISMKLERNYKTYK